MKKVKLGMLIFLITAFPFICCSCWNYKEIDTFAIVAGMAIDKDMVKNKYIVTVEVVTTQIQGITSNIGSELYSTEGDSIFEAVKNLIEKTGLRLYWSDTKTIIISESLARSGVIPVIDFINRDSEPRYDMWLLISRNSTAGEILRNKVILNEIVSFHIDDGMNSEKLVSKYTDSKLISFINGIMSPTRVATVAMIKNEPTDDKIAARINGAAIFKGDKLVGYLDGDETLYMLMIKNKIRSGLIILKNPTSDTKDVTLEIFGNKSKLIPSYINGTPFITIEDNLSVDIAEIGGTTDFTMEENLKKLKSETEKKLVSEFQLLINKMQHKYDADIFGFEEVFEKNMPKISEKFKKSNKDIFEAMKFKIHVKVSIKGSATVSKPISEGK